MKYNTPNVAFFMTNQKSDIVRTVVLLPNIPFT